MLELLLFLLGFILGWALGWTRGFHRAIHNLVQHYAQDPGDLDRAFAEVRKAQKELAEAEVGLTVTVEQVQGQYYAYSSQGQFLAQGTDPEQVRAQAQARLSKQNS